MSSPVITVDHLSKHYRLGVIGATTLRESVERWWHRMRGADPRAHMGRIDPTLHDIAGAQEENAERELWALRDVSFTVDQGEVLGVIGKNGAGKSTLLKILTRITEPTSGRAVINGRMASLLEVGTGFHPELTGRENIYLNGAILGMKRTEIAGKFDEIVDFSGISRFIDTPVKRYSSGMYVRLAFAVAAHLDPEILLIDEVLAVGDAEFQKKCLGKMKDVAGQGRTVLFVSHNMPAVLNLCSRCVLLKQGAIEQIGETEAVVRRYLDSGQVQGAADIGERKDRGGNGLVRLTGFKVRREGSSSDLDELSLHDDAVFELSVHAAASTEISVRVRIRDEYGKTISYLSMLPRGLALHVEKGERRFLLKLPGIPLIEGTYYIDVLIFDRFSITLLDDIENARRLIMLPKDVHGAGYRIGSGYGVSYIPHAWKTAADAPGTDMIELTQLERTDIP